MYIRASSVWTDDGGHNKSTAFYDFILVNVFAVLPNFIHSIFFPPDSNSSNPCNKMLITRRDNCGVNKEKSNRDYNLRRELPLVFLFIVMNT